ncbi:HET-domain-containing protein [Hypomontagnella monticulosa]|nr:HET-domain-containing protein [Hypomontagnella monticulosa]
MDITSIYTPLSKEKAQIRILLLLPGSFNDPIRCDLSVESTQVTFEALSYVWGDMSDTLPIEIQGQRKKVTKNLEAALRHMRSESETRRLWVDAVCINQDDNIERKHQVGLMDKIYGEAERVIVWLGQWQSGQLPALQAVQHFGANPDLHWDPTKRTPTEENIEAPTLQLLMWLRNAWYTRIWTLQEAILAKSLIYICGSFVFQRGEIDGIVESFQRHFSRNNCCSMMNIEGKYGLGDLDIALSYSMWRMAQMADLQKKRGPTEFLDVASRFRHRQATNPRDKVFGVLGLANDLPKDIIDYEKSIAEIYSSATIECIKNSGNLDVLSHVLPKSQKIPKDEAAQENHSLPSWVPDWSDHRPNEAWRLLGLCERQSLTKLFNACHQNSQACPECPSQSQLGLMGIFFDKIHEFGESMIFRSNTVKPSVLRNWRKMVNIDNEPEAPYISGSTMFDAYWRTLCMNTAFADDSSVAGSKKANADTRALHDTAWWELLLHDKYTDLPGQTRRYDTPVIRAFLSHIGFLSSGRKLFISEKGYLGLAPEDAQDGDEIWILNGGRVPLILRPIREAPVEATQSDYTFVGDSYVHGIMDGEFVDASMKKGEMPRPVVLV